MSKAELATATPCAGGTYYFLDRSHAGLTKVASISEELQEPDRNLPLGMALVLFTASAVYVVGVSIMVAVIDPDVLHDGDLTPIATAGLALFDWIPRPVALGRRPWPCCSSRRPLRMGQPQSAASARG